MHFQIKIKSQVFALLIALYFVFVLNIAFLFKLISIFQGLEHLKIGVVLAIPVLLTVVLNILCVFTTVKYIAKPLIIIWLVLSAIVSYQAFNYGVVFDVNMVTSIFETHKGEVAAFINYAFLGWVLGLGVLPGILVYKTSIVYNNFFKELYSKLLSCIVSLVIIALIFICYYKDIASIARNNPNLRKDIIPTYFTYSLFKYIKYNYLTSSLPYTELGLDAKVARAKPRKNNLLIMVVGETARSKNYQLNGYYKDTNRYTKQHNIISFQNIKACGTSTAISVPCMFSRFSRSDYRHFKAANQDNLLDILKRTGVNLLWLDNDDGCKGVCKNINTVKIKPKNKKWCDGLYCYDEVLLENIQERINKLKNNDAILFLHIIGSHGPTYYRRYPAEHRKYLPECSRSDIQNCTNEALVNTYDNTILYTDYILGKLIDVLKQNETDLNTSLIYISDHGESLGEYGLYLHATPYFMAPEEQTKVPLMMWFSNSFIKQNLIDIQDIKLKAKNNEYAHDNLFDSILGLMNVKTDAYNKDLDIFYNNSRS